MSGKVSVVLGLSVVILLGTGCVSTGTYELLQAELVQTRQELEKSVADCNAQKDQCNQDLEGARADGERQKADRAALEKKLSEVLKDKAQLDASVEEMSRAMAELARRQQEADKRIEEFRKLVERFKNLIDAGKLKVKIIDGRMIVELATDVLFASGSASLSKEGEAAITEVTQILTSIPDRKFQIEGHTDNVPIRSAKFPSNWVLASSRALSVIDTMLAAGIPPDRVSAASFGDMRPTQTNETPVGRAANRRIEIVIVPDLSMLPGFDELQRLAGESK